MAEEKRQFGSYKIFQSFLIGDREVVMAEDIHAAEDEMYLCAFVEDNGIMQRLVDTMVSDDYTEIAQLFADRIKEQAKKAHRQTHTRTFQGYDDRPIRECTPITYQDNLEGRIVVINPDKLRREYRLASCQLKLCIGGFGAYPGSRGTSCLCVDLHTGRHSSFRRSDVLGTMTEAQLPEWAQLGLSKYRDDMKRERNER